MATRKQRRRRDKERRHEYEYVYVDDEGREVEVDEAAAASDGAKGSGKRGRAPSPRAVTTSGGRVVEPPTWRRVLRRGALFTPLMALVLYIMPGDNKTAGTVLASTAMLMAFFIPFSYAMDSMMYRFAVKRGAKPRGVKDSSRA